MNDPEKDPSARKDEVSDVEAQQEAAFRYFVRLHQKFFVVVFVAAAVFVAFRPTTPRVVGLIIIAAITGSSFLYGRVSARVIGFATIGLGVLFTVVAAIARQDWMMEWNEFAMAGVSCAGLGLVLVFTNKQTGEASPTFENVAGVLAFISLIAIGVIVFWIKPDLITRPAGLVAIEAAGAFAGAAGDKWKWRISAMALFPIVGLILVAQPQLKQSIPSNVRSGVNFFAAHNHTWMIFPIVTAFGAIALQSYNAKVGGRASLRNGLVGAFVVWLFLFVVDAL